MLIHGPETWKSTTNGFFVVLQMQEKLFGTLIFLQKNLESTAQKSDVDWRMIVLTKIATNLVHTVWCT